jgi:hypothetical protein
VTARFFFRNEPFFAETAHLGIVASCAAEATASLASAADDRLLTANQFIVMSGLIVVQSTELPEQQEIGGSHRSSAIAGQEGGGASRLLDKAPVETGEQRIQEDPSAVITFRESAMPFSLGAVMSTATQPPVGEAAIQAERDEDRLLAVQLLNLEWTSLSFRLQRAVVLLLSDLAKGR